MSFCDISFNRKSGVVTDVLNKEGRESALYPQLVSYVQQDPQTVYDSKKEYFDTLVDQGKLVDKSTGELSLGLYSIAYNSGASEQEFMDKIKQDGNLSVFGVGGKQVFNQTVPVQQVSVEQERKLKNIAYEHFNVYSYKDYMDDQDKYNVPWIKSYVGESMMVFGGSDATIEQLNKEKQKITDRVTEAERKVEQIYRQYLEQGGDVNSLKQFRHYVESEQYVLTDKSGITQTGIDTNLSQKIQNLLQEKYPEIKLDITNAPVWENSLDVFNQREKNKAAYDALVEYYNEQFEEQEEQELMTEEEKQLSKGRLNKLFSLRSQTREEYNEETEEYETVGDTENDEENQNLVDKIYDNYDKAIGRTSSYRGNLKRHILSGNGIVYMPFADDNSALVGFPIDDIFVVSHFAPSSLRMGKELIDNIAKEKMPVVIAVPEYQAAQLEKSGFRFITEIPQYFGGEVVMKKVMVNKATTENDLKNLLEHFQSVQFQKSSNKIIGQANIKAMTVLIDAVNQKQDTLPHEYAHHYIAWFRNTPMVREAIRQWGSEEALVQAIGEQVVAQKGEALSWWKRFVRLVLSMFSKVSNKDRENIKNMLTSAFLEARDLQTGQVGISRERSKELARKTKDQNVNTFLDEVKNTRLSADNAIFASRLKNLDAFTKNIKIEENSNISGAAKFDAFTNTISVSNKESLLSDTIAFENIVLEEIMVGAAQNGLKIGQLKIPFVEEMLKELRKRNQWQKERNMGLNAYEELYLENTNSFVSAYLKADKQFISWVKSIELNNKALQSIIAKEIAEAMFQTNQKYFTAKLEKYFNEIGNATKTVAPGLVKDGNPITNNLQDLREDYAAVQNKFGNEFDEKDIQKNPEKYADVLETIEAVNKNYGGNVLKILIDGQTRRIKVDLKEMERLSKEAKKEKKNNTKKQNDAEFTAETKNRMVDTIPELQFLSEDEKRIAEDMLQSGEFQIFCGL